jgi:hypothetical protein
MPEIVETIPPDEGRDEAVAQAPEPITNFDADEVAATDVQRPPIATLPPEDFDRRPPPAVAVGVAAGPFIIGETVETVNDQTDAKQGDVEDPKPPDPPEDPDPPTHGLEPKDDLTVPRPEHVRGPFTPAGSTDGGGRGGSDSGGGNGGRGGGGGRGGDGGGDDNEEGPEGGDEEESEGDGAEPTPEASLEPASETVPTEPLEAIRPETAEEIASRQEALYREYDERFRGPVEALQYEVHNIANPEDHPGFMGRSRHTFGLDVLTFRVEPAEAADADPDAPPETYVTRVYPPELGVGSEQLVDEMEFMRCEALERALQLPESRRRDLETLVARDRNFPRAVTEYVDAPDLASINPADLREVSPAALKRARDTMESMAEMDLEPQSDLGQGKGVLWDAAEQRFVFVDYRGQMLINTRQSPRGAALRRENAHHNFSRLLVGIIGRLDPTNTQQAAAQQQIIGWHGALSRDWEYEG